MKVGGDNLKFIISATFYLNVKKDKHILRYLRMLTMDHVLASFKDLLKLVILYVNNWENMIVKKQSLGKR